MYISYILYILYIIDFVYLVYFVYFIYFVYYIFCIFCIFVHFVYFVYYTFCILCVFISSFNWFKLILGLFIFDYFLSIYKGWAPGLRRGGAEALAHWWRQSTLKFHPGRKRLLPQRPPESTSTSFLSARICKAPADLNHNLHVYVYIYM